MHITAFKGPMTGSRGTSLVLACKGMLSTIHDHQTGGKRKATPPRRANGRLLQLHLIDNLPSKGRGLFHFGHLTLLHEHERKIPKLIAQSQHSAQSWLPHYTAKASLLHLLLCALKQGQWAAIAEARAWKLQKDIFFFESVNY